MPETPPQLAAIVAANAEHTPPPRGTARPKRSFALVTCMDARIDPVSAFGLAPGDAHILRNAGGHVTDDMLRSLLLSVHLLGTREIGVVHHTGCALEGTTNQAIRGDIPRADAIDFLPFDDVEQSVRNDVGRLYASTLLPPNTLVWGGVYDVDTGTLTIVVGPERIAPEA